MCSLLLDQYRFCLVGVALLFSILCQAQSETSLEVDTGFISHHILPDLLRDDDHQLQIEDIIAGKFPGRFVQAKSEHLAFGFDNARWWLHFRVHSNLDKPRTFILRLNRKTFDEFTLWQQSENSPVKQIGGVGQIFDDEKFVLINGYYYAVTVQPGTNEFWARCRNEIGPMHLTMSLHSPENYAVFSRQSSLVYGVFLGVMVLSLFFTSLLFYFYRKRLYIIYVIYILNILAREAYYNSADFDFLPVFQRYCTSILIAATYALLFRRFLKLKEIYPRLDRVVNYYAWTSFLMAFGVYGLVLSHHTAVLKVFFVVINISNLLFIVMALGVTLRHFFSRYQARIMFVGSFPIAVAFTIISLRNLSVIPNYPFIQFVVACGFIVEVLVFAIAFARWYRTVEIDRDLLKLKVSVEAKEKQLAIQEAEQRVKDRIARDLHDDVAASLSSIRILSQIVKRQISEKAPESSPLLEQITGSAQSTLDSIGDIIWAINPHTDYLNDVADRIREYAVKTLELQEISFNLDISRNLPAFNLDVEARRNIYLIFKEAINNALKHANCTHMEIKLMVVDQEMTLTIRDNGIGFDLQHIRRGNGLNNMHKRAKDISGVLSLCAEEGKGTTVTFKLPLPSTKAEIYTPPQ